MNHPFGQFGYQSAGYNPIYGQMPPQSWQPYQGAPGGVIGSLALQALVDPMFKGMGMHGLGFNSQQNVYDRLQLQRLETMNREVLAGSTAGDARNMYNTITGMYGLAGVSMTPDQQRAVQDISQHVAANAAPILGQLGGTGLLDALGGSRGSSTALAINMRAGARYRLDPITGQMGMSAASQIATNNAIMGIAGTADVNFMRAGELGETFTELQRRGMMGRASRDEGLAAAAGRSSVWQTAFDQAGLGKARDAKSLSASEVDKLMGTDAVKGTMREIDTNRVQETLKKYSGAITAMRDIFGDAGNPNAPMAVIMNALEQLTQGGMSQIQPQKVEQMVRTMNNLAKSSGIGLEGAMLMMQSTSAYAQQLGLNPVLAADAVTGAMGFATAYNNSGIGNQPMWGLSSANHLAQMDANLRASAMSSPMANQMATAMRIKQAIGKGTMGKDAEAYFAAVNNGNAQFMEESAFVKMMTEGGHMTQGQVRQMLAADFTNQEYILKHGLGDKVRSAQFQTEVQPMMANAMAYALRSSKVDRATSHKAADAAMQAISAMDPRTRADSQLRNSIVAGILQQHGVGGSEQDRMLMAENMWGASESRLRHDTGMTNADALALGDKGVLDAARKETVNARALGVLQGAMGGKGKTGGIMQNLLAAIQDLDLKQDPDAARKVIAKSLGAQDDAEIVTRVSGALDRIRKMKDDASADYETERDKIMASKMSPEEKAKAAKNLAAQQAKREEDIDAFIKAQVEQLKADGMDINAEAVKEAAKQGIAGDGVSQMKIAGELVVRNVGGEELFRGDVEADGSQNRNDPVPNAGKAGVANVA